MLLADVTDFFDRAPRGAAVETLQKFGVRSGTPFSSYLRALRVVVASTVEKGGPLAPSADTAIELVRIRTAQQYPMLMSTLFPGEFATKERPFCTLALMWTAFANLKHNTTPAINGDDFTSASQASSSHALAHKAPLGPPIRRPGHPAAHGVASVDYGLWPFDDNDYDIVCTVTNHTVNTDLSL